MICKECGMKAKDHDRICAFCGAPLPVQKKRSARAESVKSTVDAAASAAAVRRTVAEKSAAQRASDAHAMAEMLLRRRRREDLVYGFVVAFLVLLALVSATLCYLLLTRGPDPDRWFQGTETALSATQTASLPTPAAEKTAEPSLPTPVTVTATPTPAATPTAAPSPTPTPTATPQPTQKVLSQAELEALVLEGIERDYTKEELEDLKKSELSILRNGMYAYSGLNFQRNEQIREFFSACDWYAPNTSDDEKVYKRFNSHQIKNVAAIIAVEKEKGYR